MGETHETKECEKDDALLEKFTSLRFAIMGLLLLARTLFLLNELEAKKEQHPFKDHPEMTKQASEAGGHNIIVRIFFAGLLFIQAEGVGLVIYFMTAAALDNYTIYFVENVNYCEYVMQAALYSMSLVTFLPTVIIAYLIQGTWYEKGIWNPCSEPDGEKMPGGKVLFVGVMMGATMVSFFFRLFLVYKWGWDDFVNGLMQGTLSNCKVIVAITVPPLVDALQTIMLMWAAAFTKRVGVTSKDGAVE